MADDEAQSDEIIVLSIVLASKNYGIVYNIIY